MCNTLDRRIPEPISLNALSALVRRTPHSLSRSLRNLSCPPFTARRGPTGRLLAVSPDPALVRWLE